MKLAAALTMLALSGPALAEANGIPTEEGAFLEVIPHITPARMVELLGEPEKTILVLDEDSGEKIGTIVYYGYINTNSEGEYYKTTELDYLGDRLMTVVFSNSDPQETATTALAPGKGECRVTC